MDTLTLAHIVKKPLTSPTIGTSDAGQAYEVLEPSQVMRDLDFILKRAEDTGSGLLQVFKFVKSIVGVSKSLHRGFDDREVFTSVTIRKCVNAYMQFRIFRFANVHIKQLSGVPIGGWLSSALLHLRASACESRFEARFADCSSTFGERCNKDQLFLSSAMKTMH